MSGCGQPLQLMDRTELMNWILRRLGAPRWNIELHPCQLETALDDAIQWFVKWKGAHRVAYDTLLADKVVYNWPDDADYILDVVPPGNENNLFADVGSLGLAGLGGYNSALSGGYYRESYSAGGPISSLAQSIQYTDTASRVTSQEWNWWTERATRAIHVSPVPRHTGTLAIRYKSACFAFADLPVYDHELLKRYAFAVAREMLGLIRRKYNAVETAGTSKQLDGEQLVQEGREDQEKLTEEMQKSGYPMPLIPG